MTYQEFQEIPEGTVPEIKKEMGHYVIVCALMGTAMFYMLGPCSLPLWMVCVHKIMTTRGLVVEDLSAPRAPRYWLVAAGRRAELNHTEVLAWRKQLRLIQLHP